MGLGRGGGGRRKLLRLQKSCQRGRGWLDHIGRSLKFTTREFLETSHLQMRTGA